MQFTTVGARAPFCHDKYNKRKSIMSIQQETIKQESKYRYSVNQLG